MAYFCKCMPSLWQKVVYTPPICITIRLPFVSRYFCGSIRVRGRWDTPKKKLKAKRSKTMTNLAKLVQVGLLGTNLVQVGPVHPCPTVLHALLKEGLCLEDLRAACLQNETAPKSFNFKTKNGPKNAPKLPRKMLSLVPLCRISHRHHSKIFHREFPHEINFFFTTRICRHGHAKGSFVRQKHNFRAHALSQAHGRSEQERKVGAKYGRRKPPTAGIQSGKCRVLIFLRVWSFDSHALFILSADDFGRLLWHSVEIAQNRRQTKCTEHAS